ncbi:class I SAM-dependent methyltransferase [Paenibacillus dendritiformis]|uniref:class I SAM-dependent methyltransferase n=1 Tax=Paenibacillus dendritiformis TaxID=130049 RepID=UPI00387E1503
MTIMEWNLSEYKDPTLYDLENQGNPELPMLLAWAKKLEIQGKPMLDLACGTGRTALPLAEAGYSVIGVDLHAGMLEQARRKTPAGADIRWVQQDLTQLQLEERSPLAYMTGNGFQHFLTNELQNRLLQSIRSALTPDGILLFDTRFPAAEELLQPPVEEYWRTIEIGPEHRCDVYTIATYDPVAQVQHYTTIRRFLEGEELREERKTTIELRYTYPQELARTLEANGYELLHLYGGWSGASLHPSYPSMVAVCRRA